jgi:hypothetical protein
MGCEDVMNARELRLVVIELRATIAEQARCITDQQRQIVELRAAVDALLQPAPSELLAKNLAHPSRRP